MERLSILNDRDREGEYQWRTSITHIEPNKILIRGYRIEDLIGNVSYPQMIGLLLRGELPSKRESLLLDDLFVASTFVEIPREVMDYISFIAPTSSLTSITASAFRSLIPQVNELGCFMRELQEHGTGLISEHFDSMRTKRDLGKELLRSVIDDGAEGESVSALRRLTEDGKRRVSSRLVIGAVLNDLGWDWQLGPYIFLLGSAVNLYATVHSLKSGERLRYSSKGEEVGWVSSEDRIYSILRGMKPEEIPEENARLLNGILVACSDHGTTPPTAQVARLVASTRSFSGFDAALHAFGPEHSGAIQKAMEMLYSGVELERKKGWDLKRTVGFIWDEFNKNGKKIPGFGHRYHLEDPRPKRIRELAKRYGVASTYLGFAEEMEELLYREKGIRMNVDGGNAACLLDMGFPWTLGNVIFMIGRGPGLIAHIQEELTTDKPFSHKMRAIYTGREERNLPYHYRKIRP
jgi:citrate synthase